MTRKPKSASWPKHSIAVSTGDGRKGTSPALRRAGSRSAAFSTMAGRATTKRRSSMCWVWLARPPTPATATKRGRRPTSGKTSTARSALFRPAVHAPVFACLDRFRGIRDAFMREKNSATISKTAAVRPTSTATMRGTTPMAMGVTTRTCGDFRQATGRAAFAPAWSDSVAGFPAMPRVASVRAG